MLASDLVKRRVWQEWAIVASILALAVIGFLAIWGDTVTQWWERTPTTEPTAPRFPGTQGRPL